MHTIVDRYQFLCATIFVLLAGCAAYDAKPLDKSAVERALAGPSSETMRTAAQALKHPLVRSIDLDPRQGISPDSAAVIAVLVNPSLRAERDRRSLAEAQLLVAGILPNPQFVGSVDFPNGGNSEGAVTGYGVGLDWEVTSLITRQPRVDAAKLEAASVELDVAWNEWQVAQAARLAVFNLAAMRDQLRISRDFEKRLQENLANVQSAVDRHQQTLIDLAAAQASVFEAHQTTLGFEHDVRHQELVLAKAIGFPPDTSIVLKSDIQLPSNLNLPSLESLVGDLEERRLDLLALKRGYESQDATLRAAVLAQFPKINLGFNQSSDTSNVHTFGLGATIDIPIFDRNQGTIATEQSTRQKLFDEYVNRVQEARSDVALSLADIRSLNSQIAAAEESLPSLRNLAETYRAAMDKGNMDVLSYYTAVNNVSQKEIDVMKLKQQLTENRIALEIAAGRYFPDEVAR